MSHWYSIRKKYPKEYLIAYRMGDFYEFFYEDAIRVSRLLGLTLTKRGKGKSRHYLAGIPHQAKQHFKALVKQGKTVIIVEQLEDPKDARKANRIVKRGVVRILSPGTVVDNNLLDSGESNFISTITKQGSNYGLAFIDVSSGEFYVLELSGSSALMNVWSYLSRYDPVECVLSEKLVRNSKFMSQLRENTNMVVKEFPTYQFSFENARMTILKHFNIENLFSFGIEDDRASICAGGGLLAFIRESYKKESLKNITKIQKIQQDSYMFLDCSTQRNLELLQNQTDGSSFATLFSIMDDAKTPMGTRLLKKWIVQPLLSKMEIENRLETVEWFLKNYEIRIQLRDTLKQMGDLMRLATRINYSSTANARDLNSIKFALKVVKEIRRIFNSDSINNIPKHLEFLIDSLDNFDDVIDLIENSIKEDPPTTITEGGVIKKGYNEQIDEYRDILENGKDWIIQLEEQEKEKLDISSGLKIGFNRVLGYYIEITKHKHKSVKNNLPDNYTKRQTLKNSIRFETEKLKEMETKILSAEENLFELEYEIFQEVREKVQDYTLQIQENAQIIAQMDVLSNFASLAQNYDYNKPKIKDHKNIIIKQGRHPVVEKVNKREPFVPNDCYMNRKENQVLIITGPNWSGKSTYLRQVALIVLMGQIGSYVPASDAEIGIVDRIFTRIGASDDLARGQSTFMLEMNEMSEILNYMTQESLIIIDEIGRGTGTIDGLSIAQSVVEYLHDYGVKTLFSTHFHHLINLELPRVHNYHFKIMEKDNSNDLIFLRQLTEGGTDKSYGIHVGEMAGLPKWVVERAFELMNVLSDEDGCGTLPELPDKPGFSQEIHKLEKELREKHHKIEAKAQQLKKKEKEIEKKKKKIKQEEKDIKEKLANKEKEWNKKQKSKPSETSRGKKSKNNKDKKKSTVQMALFPIDNNNDPEIAKELKKIDLKNLTPLEAMNLLQKLKEKVEN